MKHWIVSIPLITMMTTLSLVASGNELYGKPIVIVAQPQTVTRNVLVRANVLRIHKPKLLVGNPHKITIFAEDSDDDYFEVDDIISAYRRRDLTKLEHSDDLPEHIRWRLFLARQLALLKYRKNQDSELA